MPSLSSRLFSDQEVGCGHGDLRSAEVLGYQQPAESVVVFTERGGELGRRRRGGRPVCSGLGVREAVHAADSVSEVRRCGHAHIVPERERGANNWPHGPDV